MSSACRVPNFSRERKRNTLNQQCVEPPNGKADRLNQPNGIQRDVLVVGIFGCSGVGKSTLAKNLRPYFRVPIWSVPGDLFFKAKPPMCDITNKPCRDTFSSMNYARYREQLRTVVQALEGATVVPALRVTGGKKKIKVLNDPRCVGQQLDDRPVVVFTDSHLLAGDVDLLNELHAVVWVKADLNDCAHRRCQRERQKKLSFFDPEVAKFSEWFTGHTGRHHVCNERTARENIKNSNAKLIEIFVPADVDALKVASETASRLQRVLPGEVAGPFVER